MNDLKRIKKHYGEKMMHLCRELFPTILENEGQLWSILTSVYPYSKHLYDDIKKMNNEEIFKRTIYGLFDDKDRIEVDTGKTPKELLDEAGYDFYECNSNNDIQSFKKYYAEGEELCTFKSNRLSRCFVFWAVKKNVDSINRRDFKNPEREDEYGTSVMSIQFARDGLNTPSIKNRYNHSVNYPDSTFSNNLDNIIPGLKKAFEKTYNLNLSELKGNTLMSGYVQANDGKYYKYNYEINNIYYCPDNIIIDNSEVKKYDKSKYIVLDYFIIDLVNKTIKTYDESINDSFIEGLTNINNIKVEVDKDSKNRIITINGDIEIILDKTNKLISYKNHHLKQIDRDFLSINKILSNIEIPNVKYIDSNFLLSNCNLKNINLPNVEYIGDSFLYRNNYLSNINLPKVKEIESRFMVKNIMLEDLELPNIETIGDHFLEENKVLFDVDISNAKHIGNNFLLSNEKLRSIDLSNAITIGSNLLGNNMNLEEINIDSLEEIGDYFLATNRPIKKIIEEKLTCRNR